MWIPHQAYRWFSKYNNSNWGLPYYVNWKFRKLAILLPVMSKSTWALELYQQIFSHKVLQLHYKPIKSESRLLGSRKSKVFRLFSVILINCLNDCLLGNWNICKSIHWTLMVFHLQIFSPIVYWTLKYRSFRESQHLN